MLLKELYVDAVSMRLLGPSAAKDCLCQASTVHESHLPSSPTSPPPDVTPLSSQTARLCVLCAIVHTSLLPRSRRRGTRCLPLSLSWKQLVSASAFCQGLNRDFSHCTKVCGITAQRFWSASAHMAALSPEQIYSIRQPRNCLPHMIIEKRYQR